MPKRAATPAPAPPPPMSGVGSLIRKQREAVQMTVAQLAGRIGVSRNTITNYEAGKTEPNASDLVRLSSALGCTVTDLLHGGTASVPPRFAFRAHAPLRKDPEITVAARKFLRAYDEIEEIMDSRLSGTLRTFDTHRGDPLTREFIKMVADTLRKTSGLHDSGPENIVSVLEGLGVRALFFYHDSKGLDGLSTIHGEKRFIMLRNRDKVIERTIFSAAHELGHLVLHSDVFNCDEEEESDDKRDYEGEADAFAGHFLVPTDELVRVWEEERLKELKLFDALILLKSVFHVSFRCLYYRVIELRYARPVEWGVFINQIKQHRGIVGPAKLEDLEPDPLPINILYKSNRFSRLVHSAFLRDLIGVSKVAEMFQIPIDRAKEITTDWVKPRCDP